MQRIKPILPSLREKKRYVLFRVVSEGPLGFKAVARNMKDSILSFIGEKGYAESGFILLPEKWNKSKQTGIFKIGHKHVSDVKMALSLTKNIEHEKVIIHSLAVSGILNKTGQSVINGGV